MTAEEFQWPQTPLRNPPEPLRLSLSLNLSFSVKLSLSSRPIGQNYTPLLSLFRLFLLIQFSCGESVVVLSAHSQTRTIHECVKLTFYFVFLFSEREVGVM